MSDQVHPERAIGTMHRSVSGQTTYTIYPVSGYTFGLKSPKIEKDHSVADRLQRMKTKYEKEGQRRSVEGILLVWEHNHPHVLLLQVGNSFFKLPGGRLRPGEEEIEGLKRKLCNNLSPVPPNPGPMWEIGECIGVYWRPNFETIFYPYLPPHVTKPKECKKLFVVPLPDKCNFAIPKNLKLLAVPLFELYDNVARYGPVISAIPQMVSRLRLNTVAFTPRALHSGVPPSVKQSMPPPQPPSKPPPASTTPAKSAALRSSPAQGEKGERERGERGEPVREQEATVSHAKSGAQPPEPTGQEVTNLMQMDEDDDDLELEIEM